MSETTITLQLKDWRTIEAEILRRWARECALRHGEKSSEKSQWIAKASKEEIHAYLAEKGKGERCWLYDPAKYPTRTRTPKDGDGRQPETEESQQIPVPVPVPVPVPTVPTVPTAKAEHLAFVLQQLLSQGGLAPETEARLIKLEGEIGALREGRPVHHTFQIIPQSGPPSVPTVAHVKFERLLLNCSLGISTCMVGPSGSFKTSSARLAAESLNREFRMTSVCSQTTKGDLLGYQDATGRYIPSQLAQAYQSSCVFLLDELDGGNANVLNLLNAIAEAPFFDFGAGRVERHPEFILLAAGNTWGNGANSKHVGRVPLDGATLNRFQRLFWPYDDGMERQIVSSTYETSPNRLALLAWCDRFFSIRKAIDAAGAHIFATPRQLFRGAALINAGVPQREVEDEEIWAGVQSELRDRILATV